MRIRVEVKGKPPRKNGCRSLWNKSESERVLNLRLAVHKEQKKLGINGPLEGCVKIGLEVFAPNITDIESNMTYVGDADTFVAGICESIQPAHKNVKKISPVFKGHAEVKPNIPLAINDDAQVTEINARKIKNKNEKYVLVIETVDCD